MNTQSNELKKLLAQNEKLRLKLQKQKGKPSTLIGFCFLFFGIFIIGLSVLYESSLLMFIGLATTLWGSLLLFIRPTRYIRSTLLNSTVLSSLEALDQLIKGLEYKGKAVYLPPRPLKKSKGGQIFIPKKDVTVIPPVKKEETQQVFAKNPNGIYITPPGAELTNLFEEELGKNFAEVSLEYLVENLPKVFIEDLEIAKNCEISIKNDLVTTKITGVTHDFLCQRLHEKSTICNTIGCPFSSAIACALARSTGKPVVIEEASFSKEDKVVQVKYRILGE